MRAPCCGRVVKMYQLGEDWLCCKCRVGDWDGEPACALNDAGGASESAAGGHDEAGQSAPCWTSPGEAYQLDRRHVAAAGDECVVAAGPKCEVAEQLRVSAPGDRGVGAWTADQVGLAAAATCHASQADRAAGVMETLPISECPKREAVQAEMQAAEADALGRAAHPWRQKRRRAPLERGRIISWGRNFGFLLAGTQTLTS